jgi:hypothetical protein
MSEYIRLALDLKNPYQSITQVYGILTTFLIPDSELYKLADFVEEMVAIPSTPNGFIPMYDTESFSFLTQPIGAQEHAHLLAYGRFAYHSLTASDFSPVEANQTTYNTYIYTKDGGVHSVRMHHIAEVVSMSYPIQDFSATRIGDEIIGTVSTTRANVEVYGLAISHNSLNMQNIKQIQNTFFPNQSTAFVSEANQLVSFPNITHLFDVSTSSVVPLQDFSQTIYVYLVMIESSTSSLHITSIN